MCIYFHNSETVVKKKKQIPTKILYISVNIFSTAVLIVVTITSRKIKIKY